MIDFSITFAKDNLSFEFTDNTDYATDFPTADETRIITKYPDIAATTEIEFNLYNINIASLGDDYTFTIADEDDFDDLIDGVYSFRLDVLASSVVIATRTIYIVNSYNARACLRTKIDNDIDKQCSDNWCEIGVITAMLDMAERLAADDDYTNAQEIMDTVADRCDGNC